MITESLRQDALSVLLTKDQVARYRATERIIHLVKAIGADDRALIYVSNDGGCVFVRVDHTVILEMTREEVADSVKLLDQTLNYLKTTVLDCVYTASFSSTLPYYHADQDHYTYPGTPGNYPSV